MNAAASSSAFVTSPALRREQIKAMRAADTAVLRWETDGTQELDLSKEVERSDGFGRETLHVRIPVRAIVTNYGRGWLSSETDHEYGLEPAVSGCWVLQSLRVNPEWATLVHLLRPGDTLVQEWIVDNRNGHIMPAGVTTHELKLRAERPRPNGRTLLLTFMLDSHAELANTSYGLVTRRQL